ncbi:MAG: thiamine phosphate synthase [Sandaracinaceae bacterium]|nr:thiamine phosphate synthase [Sandaracinaceae bacterium]
MKRVPRVHLISDARAPRGLLGSLECALEAALPEPIAVHLRHRADDRTLLDLGEHLRHVTQARGASLFINRRVDLAIAIGADGLHLPEAGMSVADARRLFPSGAIGISRHDTAGVVGRNEGADYAFLSPYGIVPGKAPPLGEARFLSIAARAPLPIIALGGVDEDALRQLRDAPNVHGFAVMRSVLHADCPRKALESLYRVFSGTV